MFWLGERAMTSLPKFRCESCGHNTPSSTRWIAEFNYIYCEHCRAMTRYNSDELLSGLAAIDRALSVLDEATREIRRPRAAER